MRLSGWGREREREIEFAPSGHFEGYDSFENFFLLISLPPAVIQLWLCITLKVLLCVRRKCQTEPQDLRKQLTYENKSGSVQMLIWINVKVHTVNPTYFINEA